MIFVLCLMDFCCVKFLVSLVAVSNAECFDVS